MQLGAPALPVDVAQAGEQVGRRATRTDATGRRGAPGRGAGTAAPRGTSKARKATSSRSPPVGVGLDLVGQRVHGGLQVLPGELGGGRRREREEHAFVPRLGGPVGVEQEPVPRHRRLAHGARRRREAERRRGRQRDLGGGPRADPQRRRVPAGDPADRPALELHEQRGHEVLGAGVAEHRDVHGLGDALQVVLAVRRLPEAPQGQRGEPHRVEPLAAHVADDHPQAGAGVDGLVQVPADAGLLRRGQVADRQRHAGQHRRQRAQDRPARRVRGRLHRHQARGLPAADLRGQRPSRDADRDAAQPDVLRRRAAVVGDQADGEPAEPGHGAHREHPPRSQERGREEGHGHQQADELGLVRVEHQVGTDDQAGQRQADGHGDGWRAAVGRLSRVAGHAAR